MLNNLRRDSRPERPWPNLGIFVSCKWATCCGLSKQVTSSGDYSEIPYVPLLDSGWLRGNTVKSVEPTRGIPKPRNVAIKGD